MIPKPNLVSFSRKEYQLHKQSHKEILDQKKIKTLARHQPPIDLIISNNINHYKVHKENSKPKNHC